MFQGGKVLDGNIIAVILTLILLLPILIDTQINSSLNDSNSNFVDDSFECPFTGLVMNESYVFDSYLSGADLILGPENHDFTLLAGWNDFNMTLWSTDGKKLNLLNENIMQLPPYDWENLSDVYPKPDNDSTNISGFRGGQISIMQMLPEIKIIGVLGVEVIFVIGTDPYDSGFQTHEFWKTDGTPEGTYSFFKNSSRSDWPDMRWHNYYDNGFEYNNKLLFTTSSYGYDTGNYIFFTDGTENGTLAINFEDLAPEGFQWNDEQLKFMYFTLTNDALVFRTGLGGTTEDQGDWWALNESLELTELYFGKRNIQFIQTNDFLYLLKTPGWVVGLSTGNDWEIRKWNSVYDFSSNQNIDWDSAPRKSGFDNSIYFDGNIYAIGDENGNTIIDDFYSETDSIHLWKYGDKFDSNKNYIKPYDHIWNREYVANISETLDSSNWDFNLPSKIDFVVSPDEKTLMLGSFPLTQEALPDDRGCRFGGTNNADCTYLFTNREKLENHNQYLTNVSSIEYDIIDEISLFNIIKTPLHPESSYGTYFSYYQVPYSTPMVFGHVDSVHIRGNDFDTEFDNSNNNKIIVNGSILLMTYDWDFYSSNGIGSRNITGKVYANYISYWDSDDDNVCNFIDTDDDNDGVPDISDIFPFESSEWLDTDLDGIGDNADNDDDDDGVNDTIDHFPKDNTEWIDTDNDGIGDNRDYDDDNDFWMDWDEVSCATNSLDNNSIPIDTDGDLICDIIDLDDDADNVSDVSDIFPLDSTEWEDNDGDGIGDNVDKDDDDDGWDDIIDAFPLDNSEWSDFDLDGIGDNIDQDDDNDGILDNLDAFPLDANRYLPESKDNDNYNNMIIPILLVVISVLLIVIVISIRGNRKKNIPSESQSKESVDINNLIESYVKQMVASGYDENTARQNAEKFYSSHSDSSK